VQFSSPTNSSEAVRHRLVIAVNQISLLRGSVELLNLQIVPREKRETVVYVWVAIRNEYTPNARLHCYTRLVDTKTHYTSISPLHKYQTTVTGLPRFSARCAFRPKK